MTVTVEVPAGMKWCKCCGAVLPKATGFYQQKKFIKTTGEVKFYPHSLCKKCADARVAALRKSAPKTPKPQTSLPRVASDIVDAAWLEALVVFRKAGRLQWRARHRGIPLDAEIIGAYDKGARFDCVLEDLRHGSI